MRRGVNVHSDTHFNKRHPELAQEVAAAFPHDAQIQNLLGQNTFLMTNELQGMVDMHAAVQSGIPRQPDAYVPSDDDALKAAALLERIHMAEEAREAGGHAAKARPRTGGKGHAR